MSRELEPSGQTQGISKSDKTFLKIGLITTLRVVNTAVNYSWMLYAKKIQPGEAKG